MKCDICGTHIPFGHKECPNCGYKVCDKVSVLEDNSYTSIVGIVKNIVLIALISVIVVGGIIFSLKQFKLLLKK